MVSRTTVLALIAVLVGIHGPSRAQSEAGSFMGCDAAALAVIERHARAGADADVAFASNMPVQPVAQVCKAWPFDPSITLAAVAWPRPGMDAEAVGARRLYLDVAMLADGKVLAAHRREVEEDTAFALEQDGLRLDTARYDLAPGQRAFGVVVHSAAPGPSCPEREINDELSLYLRDGESLRPALSTYLEGWDFVEGSPCTQGRSLVTDATTVTLHLERTRSHGLADVTLKAAVERSLRDVDGHDAGTATRSAQRTLLYDGNAYQTDPYAKLFFWAADGRND